MISNTCMLKLSAQMHGSQTAEVKSHRVAG